MSPEQARAERVDARTDLFSLGAVLYEMATGRGAFSASSAALTYDSILNRQPAPPTTLNASLPPELDRIISKGLEKDRELRYQSAAELRSDLRRFKREQETGGTGSSIAATANVKLWEARRAKSIVASLVVAGALIAGSSYLAFRHRPAIQSIAVLPLVNESNDASNDYIADGITEGIIDKLSDLPDLKVMSRNSVFRFKGRSADARAAGRDLNVEAVLTGRITRQADAFTISVELVKVSDGSQIWGRHFRYPIADFSPAQDDLAAAVSAKLRPSLSTADRARLSKLPTDSSEAYRLYLEGRYYWNQRRRPVSRRASSFSSRRRRRIRTLPWLMLDSPMPITWAAAWKCCHPKKVLPRPKQRPRKL